MLRVLALGEPEHALVEKLRRLTGGQRLIGAVRISYRVLEDELDRVRAERDGDAGQIRSGEVSSGLDRREAQVGERARSVLADELDKVVPDLEVGDHVIARR